MYIVYILKLSDGSYYTGQTNNLDRRLHEHQCGIGSRYVKGRRPVELIHKEEYNTRSEAMRREREIKKLSRPDKKILMLKAAGIK